MRRRRLLLEIGVLALLALASGLVAWLVWPRSGVTPENFHRLRLGMSGREVEAVFGRSRQCSYRRLNCDGWIWELHPGGFTKRPAVPGMTPRCFGCVTELRGQGVTVTAYFFGPEEPGTLYTAWLTYADSSRREQMSWADPDETLWHRLRRLLGW
jgi:hypothetical protein